MGWFRRNEHDEERLSAYLDGELDARQAENVERHLASCDACTALLEELRETRSLLSALPAQAPSRSFVLGAEYARAPVQDARPAKRLSLALAPAVALSVFVALLVVDVADFTSSSSDGGAALTMATSREAVNDDASASGGAGSLAPEPAAGGANSTAQGADATAGKSGEEAAQPTTTAPVAPDTSTGAAGSAGSAPGPESTPPPIAMSAIESPTPAAGVPEIAAAGQAADQASPVAPPQAFEAPGGGTDSGGISTLRLLEIVAGIAVLASGLYVYVWPRLSRGGS